MFDLPQAKRVRRAELDSGDSSSRASPVESEAEAEAVERFRKQQLDYIVDENVVTSQSAKAEADDTDGQAAFNLFARPTGGSGAAGNAVVRLDSPASDAGLGGVLNPTRPNRYYFAAPSSSALHAQYASSAVSGHEVYSAAQRFCPGSFYKWKIQTLPASQHRVRSNPTSSQSSDSSSKRTRLGKKGRIRKRRAHALELSKLKANEQFREVKERAEREKKARRNREKKFKKRARDKAKREAAGTSGLPGNGRRESSTSM